MLLSILQYLSSNMLKATLFLLKDKWEGIKIVLFKVESQQFFLVNVRKVLMWDRHNMNTTYLSLFKSPFLPSKQFQPDEANLNNTSKGLVGF